MPDKPRRIRVPDDLWAKFGRAVKAVDPETDRSKVLRQFMRQFVGQDELYKRPADKEET